MSKKNKKVKGKVFTALERVSIDNNPDDCFFMWNINQDWINMIDDNLGWHNLDSKDLILDIICKLKQFEKLKWSEIKNLQSCHTLPIEKIDTYARKVWKKSNLEEFNDQLFQIRISKANRVFGIIEKNIFYLLWNDPNHKVYPMDTTDNKN